MTGAVGATSLTFALATNLYQALSDRRPFAAESVMNEAMRIIQSEPDPIELVTPRLHDVLARAFAKEATLRPAPAAFADALRAIVPDAADYDAVISDRLVTWRATAAARPKTFEDVACQQTWDELGDGDDLRRCERCQVRHPRPWSHRAGPGARLELPPALETVEAIVARAVRTVPVDAHAEVAVELQGIRVRQQRELLVVALVDRIEIGAR
jgi:hypothetical protein